MTLHQANQATLLSSLPGLIVVIIVAPAFWWLSDKAHADIPSAIQFFAGIVFLATIPFGFAAGVLGALLSVQGRLPLLVRFALIVVNLGALFVAFNFAAEIIGFMNFFRGLGN